MGDELYQCQQLGQGTALRNRMGSMQLFIDRFSLYHINININLCVLWLNHLGELFKASALWADAFYKSKCPYDCGFVCLCVCVFTFEVLFKRLFAPTSWSRMSNIFRDSESLGKSNGKKWSQIWTLLLRKGVKSPGKTKFVFFGELCLSSRIFLVSVLLSASVERCFVSRMRDFFRMTSLSRWRVCYQRGLPCVVSKGFPKLLIF